MVRVRPFVVGLRPFEEKRCKDLKDPKSCSMSMIANTLKNHLDWDKTSVSDPGKNFTDPDPT